jgi:hypothetical protein
VSSYCSDHPMRSRLANRIGSNLQTVCIRIFASLSLLARSCNNSAHYRCPMYPTTPNLTTTST